MSIDDYLDVYDAIAEDEITWAFNDLMAPIDNMEVVWEHGQYWVVGWTRDEEVTFSVVERDTSLGWDFEEC